MQVQLVEGVERLDFAKMLAPISEAAFSKPPYCRGGSHEALIRGFLQQEKVYLYLVHEGDELAGFAVGTILDTRTIAAYNVHPELGCAPGDYHFTWRAVSPAHEGKGIGTLLVNIRLEQAVKLGCPRIVADTHVRGYTTRRLYQSVGFELRYRQPVIDGGKISARLFFVRSNF